ncbi:MAG: AsmA-like C-terminal region-containing protein [Planctomycetes bacterium]|nr:AsmA-like C-terminal region-containing protein [Planctomycetota bacterium]
MSRFKRLTHGLIARLGTLGWGTLFAGALLCLIEWTGLASSWVHQILSVRLSALGGELRLGSVNFRWLEPGLVLEDVSLVTEREVLSADHLHVRFGWRGGLALSPARVHLRGARVVLEPSLANGVRGLLDVEEDAKREREGGDQTELPFLPEVLIEDLTLLVEAGDKEQVEVLHVDLSLETVSDRPKVFGRVLTPRQRSERAPGSIRLSGGVDPAGVLTLRGRAQDLEITPADIPQVPELDPVREWQPSGTLDLEAKVVVDLLNDSSPRATFTGRLEEGELLPPEAVRFLDGLEILYELSFAPQDEEWLWDTSAWTGVAHASGEFAGEEFQAGGLLGDATRKDAHFEAWLALDQVDLQAPLAQLAPNARWIEELHVAAAPRGSFSAMIGTRLPRDASGEREAEPRPEMLVHVTPSRGTDMQYHGWPSRTPGRAVVGFPLPASLREGEITYAYTRRLARRGVLSLDLEFEHASGPGSVRYLKWSAPVDTPPFASASEEHLSIQVPQLEVNEELQRAVRGLDPILKDEDIWERYQPADGALGVDLYLARLPGDSEPGLSLDLEVSEVDCTVQMFPVPVSDATGWIKLVRESSGEIATAWSIGSTAGPPAFQVSGRERSRRDPEGGDRVRMVSTLELSARSVDVNGPVYAVLGEETRDTIKDLVLEGEVDAQLATYLGGSYRRALEVTPTGRVSATPEAFPEQVDELYGTLRVAWDDAGSEGEPDTHIWVPGIEGVGPNGEHVSIQGAGSATGWSGEVQSAGLTASLWDAKGALEVATSKESELSLSGVIDIEASFGRPSGDEAEEEAWDAKVEVVLRSNALMDGERPLLEELEGELAMGEGLIEAPLIKGRLSETTVLLQDLTLRNDPSELSVSTRVSASGVPLDTEHMRALLEEEVITSLVEELGMRGRVDVERGTLELRVQPGGEREVHFGGDLTLTDLALESGLPVVIQSARAHVYDLVIEDGELRGWGRIENLYGDCFESELGPVSALVSFVGGVLSVEDFTGSFERGEIRPLDPDSEPLSAVRGRPALRIELRPPFAYQASLAVDDVDASRWLEGLSSDAVTSSGTLSVKAELEGNLSSLVDTRARGAIHLERSRLWAIPLFRELLREFGLDHTVMFDEVRFRFDLEDEVVSMEDLEVRSPLLKLVGEGSLDMMGRLNHDLEVHYSIVDKITPFRRLFYMVQNVFVSVSIRGDLSRPLVRLNNGLFSVFRREPEAKLNLPLPGLSPLPPRF